MTSLICVYFVQATHNILMTLSLCSSLGLFTEFHCEFCHTSRLRRLNKQRPFLIIILTCVKNELNILETLRSPTIFIRKLSSLSRKTYISKVTGRRRGYRKSNPAKSLSRSVFRTRLGPNLSYKQWVPDKDAVA